MNKNLIKKLLLLNGLVVVINIIIYSEAIGILSIKSDNSTIKYISIVLSVFSILGFLYGNYRLLFKVSKIYEKENIEQDRDLSKEYINTLEEYRVRNPELVSVIDETKDQILRAFRNSKKHLDILNRNGTQDHDLIRDGEKFKDSVMYNIRIILNRLTILDEKDPNNARDKVIYAENLTYINEILKTNEDILSKFDEMLILVSNMKGNYIKDNSELVSILSVLDSLYSIKYEN